MCHDPANFGGDLFGQLGRILLKDRRHRFHGAGALKCALSAQQFMENQSEAENIRAVIRRHAANLLRGHVARRAHHYAGFGERGERLGFHRIP